MEKPIVELSDEQLEDVVGSGADAEPLIDELIAMVRS